MVLKQAGHFVTAGSNGNTDDVVVHQLTDALVELRRDQLAQAQGALVVAFTVDHHQQVSLRR